MPADATDVGRGLFLATAFPENEARAHVSDLLLTELPNGHCTALFFPFGSRIFAPSDLARQRLSFTMSGLGCPNPLESDCAAPRTTFSPVLDKVASFS